MPTWFCSRAWFSHVGPFDEGGQGVPEDLLFFYDHLRKGGGAVRVDQSLLLYRYHPHAATRSVLERDFMTAQGRGPAPGAAAASSLPSDDHCPRPPPAASQSLQCPRDGAAHPACCPAGSGSGLVQGQVRPPGTAWLGSSRSVAALSLSVEDPPRDPRGCPCPSPSPGVCPGWLWGAVSPSGSLSGLGLGTPGLAFQPSRTSVCMSDPGHPACRSPTAHHPHQAAAARDPCWPSYRPPEEGLGPAWGQPAVRTVSVGGEQHPVYLPSTSPWLTRP
ncbi:UDP-GlcNAc:betaGal beta-1,3-N-acetylglucosaminyltransferase-like protein 1 isoform X3 [Talpa occidentalis]|nr:UDP-GlcNAc:betaGal beta-1,3-N-acetylglucosaminyltransferase-like protein 1 isoform X3 [Talpa occidentalis]